LTTGANALVWINALGSHSVPSTRVFASFRVQGASSVLADDSRAIAFVTPTPTMGQRMGICVQFTDLVPGSNTFQMLYKNPSTGTATFANRSITVMGL
jgi:hypothetical protein